MSFLNKLELPAPAGFLLTQQLALLRELALRILEDEKGLDAVMEASPALDHVRSIPGMGPILAVVVVSEIDNIGRFPSAQKLCGYAGLCHLFVTMAGRLAQPAPKRSVIPHRPSSQGSSLGFPRVSPLLHSVRTSLFPPLTTKRRNLASLEFLLKFSLDSPFHILSEKSWLIDIQAAK
jgi:hypothetical protein